MHDLYLRLLSETSSPIRVLLVGMGWFGQGFAREILRFPRIQLVGVVVKREVEQAETYLREVGYLTRTVSDAGQRVRVAADLSEFWEDQSIDIVFDATGGIESGLRVAQCALKCGAHLLTVNSELDATFGVELDFQFRSLGKIFSNVDGDQPGVLSRMIREAEFHGFRVRVAGCCKEFLDPYQTPEGTRIYGIQGQNQEKVCAFTDGSKQAAELAVVANAFHMAPGKGGTLGPRLEKEEIVPYFSRQLHLESVEGSYVDFTLSSARPFQGSAVFCIVEGSTEYHRREMKYLKKGEGPFYLYFRDHHLCYLEAVSSLVDVGILGIPTVAPKQRYAVVGAFAKSDLRRGTRLGSYGSPYCYGRVLSQKEAEGGGLLPLGYGEWATLKADVKKDLPLRWEDVEMESHPFPFVARSLHDSASAAAPPS